MPQEIVRTEDVIECLDDRIYASSDHPNLGVLTGDDYSSILDKIEGQVCNPQQKAALGLTLTSPSTLNPVVLKDDIVTYYPSDDLGDFRDAVDTVLDLPLTGNNLGDLRPVLSINAIYRWTGTAWTPFIKTGTIDHTQLINQNADSNYLHVTLSELSSLLTQSHTHINKIVLDGDGISEVGILSVGSGIIISVNERSRIPTASEKDALSGSIYVPLTPPAPTNKYVTNVDPRLNTIKNPYITFGPAGSGATFEGSDITDIETAFAAISTGGSIDFINAIEFLPPDPLLGGVYPLNTINFQGMVWNDPKPILLEALAFRQTILQLLGSTAFWIAKNSVVVVIPILPDNLFLNPAIPTSQHYILTIDGVPYDYVSTTMPTTTEIVTGLTALINADVLCPVIASGTTTLVLTPKVVGVPFTHSETANLLINDLVTVRGITFELGTDDTLGCLIERNNTVFEDCTFTTSPSPPRLSPVTGAIGIQINADGVTLRRCVFEGNIAQAIIINGDYCLVENCRFPLASSLYSAIDITGNYSQITACEITQGSVMVSAWSQDTIFDKISLTANTSFIDAGTNTRWLGSIPQDYQQAYIGRTRTVGSVDSFADFRGSSETPFLAAMANSDTSEIEVLEGTYTFTLPVVIPVGKSIKSVKKNAVFINGGQCFILNNFNKLSGLNITISGTSGIIASGVNDIEIRDCVISISGSPTDYAINLSSVTDAKISHCQFSGTRGIYLTGDERSKISHNKFSTSGYSVISDVTTSELYYGDNTEEGSVCSLAGMRLIVRGNHFLGLLPTKIGTIDSLWIGNYPPEANNNNGIDTRVISTADLLRSIVSTGSFRSSFLGTASFAFTETGTPTVVTAPIFIGAKIDRTKGYSITLNWTATVFSGDVLWEVTTVFRDRADFVSDLGTPNVLTMLSSRTHLTVREEESVTISFTSADYGYIPGVDPTHVSLMIRRLGDDITDALPGIVYLTEAIITLPRD